MSIRDRQALHRARVRPLRNMAFTLPLGSECPKKLRSACIRGPDRGQRRGCRGRGLRERECERIGGGRGRFPRAEGPASLRVGGGGRRPTARCRWLQQEVRAGNRLVRGASHDWIESHKMRSDDKVREIEKCPLHARLDNMKSSAAADRVGVYGSEKRQLGFCFLRALVGPRQQGRARYDVNISNGFAIRDEISEFSFLELCRLQGATWRSGFDDFVPEFVCSNVIFHKPISRSEISRRKKDTIDPQ